MTPIGRLIEVRRVELGLSRAALAERLGVSVQTILNIERDENYNLGTRLLRQLEPALGIEFVITARRTTTMSNTIRMGNDEFILYMRKNYPDCKTPNPRLGKLIWQWLRSQTPAGVKVGTEGGELCIWDMTGAHASDTGVGLPRTAQQFEFDRALLPTLYTFLDSLGSGSVVTDEEA